jgi:hypothetical protein
MQTRAALSTLGKLRSRLVDFDIVCLRLLTFEPVVPQRIAEIVQKKWAGPVFLKRPLPEDPFSLNQGMGYPICLENWQIPRV